MTSNRWLHLLRMLSKIHSLLVHVVPMQFRDIFGHLFWNLGGELWAYTLVALGYQWLPQQAHSGFFHIRTEMPILAFSSLLRENKKIPVTKC